MAISIANLRTIVPTHKPRTLIYGPEGIGKTSLAAEYPSPVFLQAEDSAVEGVSFKSFGHLTSFEEFMEAVTELYNADHTFETVVVDTVDALQPLVQAATCKRNNWADIETPGFGKGYIATDVEWSDVIKGLNALRTDRNMNIVLLGHSEIQRFDDPAAASYSRYDFRLQKRAHDAIADEMDCIFFINQDPTIKVEKQGFNKERARAEGGFQRWIYTERRPVWNAKNRYNMPSQILYDKGRGYQAMKQYFPGQDAPPASPKKKAA